LWSVVEVHELNVMLVVASGNKILKYVSHQLELNP
jgi:hypothetical protein